MRTFTEFPLSRDKEHLFNSIAADHRSAAIAFDSAPREVGNRFARRAVWLSDCLAIADRLGRGQKPLQRELGCLAAAPDKEEPQGKPDDAEVQRHRSVSDVG